MKKTLKLILLILTPFLFGLFSHVALSQSPRTVEQYEIIESTNLSQIIEDNQNQSKVIILYVSSPFCPYCKKLEAEILKPMLRSGDYLETVTLRKFVIDSKQPIIGFDGQSQSPKSLMDQYQVKVTPTLLFLDKNGKQLSDAIVGYSNDEFFWYYLDMAIKKSNQRLKKSVVGSTL
ncbi:MAG: hypothetical protein COB38_12500 [Gammaproteobacteria bacterium]|nr:MAG: hypothetical protein COB38_12500 [Gammaproteobacteria bacterium]